MLKRINYYQDHSDSHMERIMLLQRKTRYEKPGNCFINYHEWL
jgi:hypothetical protein